MDYWGQVDLYIGGTEHAMGHLLYSRMWTKFIYDYGYIVRWPYKRLINRGIPGSLISLQEETLSYHTKKTYDSMIRFKYGHKAVDSTGTY